MKDVCAFFYLSKAIILLLHGFFEFSLHLTGSEFPDWQLDQLQRLQAFFASGEGVLERL